MLGPWPGNAFVNAPLDLIGSSHRWRSLVIRNYFSEAQLVELLVRMKNKAFPSLTYFSVEYIPGWLCQIWVAAQCTEHFPRLEHLGLGGPFDLSLAERVPSNLTSLALRLDDWGPCIIQHLSLQKLISLTLSGRAEALRLD